MARGWPWNGKWIVKRGPIGNKIEYPCEGCTKFLFCPDRRRNICPLPPWTEPEPKEEKKTTKNWNGNKMECCCDCPDWKECWPNVTEYVGKFHPDCPLLDWQDPTDPADLTVSADYIEYRENVKPVNSLDGPFPAIDRAIAELRIELGNVVVQLKEQAGRIAALESDHQTNDAKLKLDPLPASLPAQVTALEKRVFALESEGKKK